MLVEKSGIPVAALVSVRDLDRLNQWDRDWEEGTRAIERFSQAFADQSPEDIERETANAVAEVRAEMRSERFKALEAIEEVFKYVPEMELEREIAKALADVRANRRAEQAEPESSSA